MVAVQATLTIADENALNSFDDVTHMAFGDSTSTPIDTQTTLGNEILRVVLESATKDTVAKTYTFVGRISLFDYNDDTVNEVGVFNASTGGDMACRILSPVAATKTDNDELVFTLLLKVDTING